MKLSELDPRVRLILLIGLSTLSVVLRRMEPLLLLAVLTFAILLAGGADLKEAFGRIKGAVKLIAEIFVLQCIFTRQGEPLIAVHGFTIVTQDGLLTSAAVSLRLLILLMSAVIILTGESRDYLLALNQWKIPYEISFMVMAALRFLSILREEAQDVLYAVQMRGTKLRKTGLIHKIRVYSSILVPVAAGAIRRSEQMATAMEARAFRAMPRRTSMRKLKMKNRDWICLGIFLFLMILPAALSFAL